MQAIVVSPSSLPKAHAKIFPSSTFFTQNAIAEQLPTPAEVKAQGISQNHSSPGAWNPLPATFPELNLLVKYGGGASIAEGQCLWMIRSYLGDAVPVPEVYGWCREGEESFIYMELIRGCTLDHRWDRLSTTEKESLCEQLRPMLGALRTLRQDPAQNFVGSLVARPLQDRIFFGRVVGPFSDVFTFNDFLAQPNWNENRIIPPPYGLDPLRQGLPDSPIRFVHGDLHRRNILVTPESTEPPRVLAIVDWHQSGWFPAYWEYCKARWTAEVGEEWVTKYIPMFIQPLEEVYHSFNFFASVTVFEMHDL